MMRTTPSVGLHKMPMITYKTIDIDFYKQDKQHMPTLFNIGIYHHIIADSSVIYNNVGAFSVLY